MGPQRLSLVTLSLIRRISPLPAHALDADAATLRHQFSLADLRHRKNIQLHREQIRDIKFSVEGGNVSYMLSTGFDRTLKVKVKGRDGGKERKGAFVTLIGRMFPLPSKTQVRLRSCSRSTTSLSVGCCVRQDVE